MATVASSGYHGTGQPPRLAPLLGEILDTLEVLGSLPEQMNVPLDRGYDSQTTRQELKSCGLEPMIC